MVRRVLTLVRTVHVYGRAVWTIRCDHGIYEKVDNCNSMTSVHKSFLLAIVRQVRAYLFVCVCVYNPPDNVLIQI
jgi:hypothetical protein